MSGLSMSQRQWSQNFFEWVGGVVVSPTETLREITRQSGWLQAGIVVLTIAVVDAFLQVATTLRGGASASMAPLGDMGTTASTEFDGLIRGIAIGSAFTTIIWRPVFWAGITLIYYLIAYFLGGRGGFNSLLSGIGFAHVPMLFSLPFSAASALLSVFGSGFGLLGSLALLPVLIITWVWSLVLQVIAVREAMSLSNGRAITTVMIPILAIVALVILLLLALMALILGLIAAST